jgi:hypothetical protein
MKQTLAFVFYLVLLSQPASRAQDLPFTLSITNLGGAEISWASQTGFSYQLEIAPFLPGPWQPLGSAQEGTGGTLKFLDVRSGLTPWFYRGIKLPATPSVQISSNAVAPEAGVVYPGNTIIGAGLLGFQFSVPAAWKGGARAGSSTMLFGSDTEPGLVIGFLTLAGNAAYFAGFVGQDFTTEDGYFQLAQPVSTTGQRVTSEWALFGTDVSLRLIAVVHPSGGAIAFAGLFTEPNRNVMNRVLEDFVQSTLTVPRQTRQDLVDLISGKAFAWTKSSNVGSGGTSGSLLSWSENNAFFCPGTYEITRRSESSFSGNLSGGGFYTGVSSSNSTEQGDWTIIDSPVGPVLVMVSSSGFQGAPISIQGNTVLFGDQEFSFLRSHLCP